MPERFQQLINKADKNYLTPKLLGREKTDKKFSAYYFERDHKVALQDFEKE